MECLEFTNPLGYVFLEVRRYTKEELCNFGVDNFDDLRIEKVTPTV